MKSKEHEYHKRRLEKLKAENAVLRKKLAASQKGKKDLEKSLKSKEGLFNALHDGIVAVQQRKIVEVNKMALDLLGYTAEEVLGRDFLHFVHPSLKRYARELHEKRVAGKHAPEEYEIDLIKKDGEPIRCDISVKKTQMNGRMAFLARMTRLEVRKRKERALIHSRKTEALSTMASGLAKKLGASLSRIADCSADAQKVNDLKNQDLLDRLREIEPEADHLMSAMSELAKISGGKHAASEVALFDLKKAVQEAAEAAIQRLGIEAKKRSAEIHFKTYLRSGSTIEGDRKEIQDMIVHVIQNAVEAMPKGGNLYLSMEENAGFAVIYVQDSGVGIPEEIQDRMLDPFFTTKGKDGMGLGLSLCAAIVKRHRGSLEITSKENHGTIITIRLPLASKEKKVKGKRVRSKIKDAQILLIEEDDMVREILSQVLGSKGYRVLTAISGADGLSQMKRKTFDMVIIDGATSSINGHALARKIKTTQKGLSLALILEQEAIKNMDGAQKRVADLIIGKPLDVNQVVNQVSQVLADSAHML